MYAELIAIGDELTSGQRLDTNTRWLAQRLEEIGVTVIFHTTVGDDLAANIAAFRAAAERAEVVVSTGGLGPTADDLTRQALAGAAGEELVPDPVVLEHIRRLFARRQRPMPERNAVQALFPRGSRPIPNPHGTAPGIALGLPRQNGPPARVFALPGVPAEMFAMWEQSVLPAVQQLPRAHTGLARCIRHHTLRCFGVGESELEAMLPDLIRRGRQPRVGITVSRATITLRITATATTPHACQQLIEPTAATIRECLGDLVFGEGEDELQDAVIRLLADARQTVSSVEYGPGGLLAHWLSRGEPEGLVYRGGWVLRDSPPTLPDSPAGLTPTPTSDGDALVAVTEQARAEFATDWCLAVGPFPPSDADRQPAGHVQLALVGPHGPQHQFLPFAGHPDVLTARTVKQVLNLLRHQLLATKRRTPYNRSCMRVMGCESSESLGRG